MTRVSESVSVRHAAAVWLASVAAPAFAQTVTLPPAPAGVQVTHDGGFEFVQIPALNNAPISDTGGPSLGRGAISESYRISRTEVSTADWLPFANLVIRNLDSPALAPLRAAGSQGFEWGAVRDPNYPGPGEQFCLANAQDGLIPVTNMSWRYAALYCNWLCNGRSDDILSVTHGAYELSTFGQSTAPNGNQLFTDQLTHSPAAQFFIPSWDQWLAAAHYDPNRNGAGQGGWWQFPTGSDNPPVPGEPGTPGAETSAGIGRYFPALTMYPGSMSPWGLLDVSGGASEWTESVLEGVPEFRIYDGSNADDIVFGTMPDDIAWAGWDHPWAGYGTGLRIAAAVPGPGPWLVSPLVLLFIGGRKRR